MNEYRKLMEDISVPKELNNRVLRAARQRDAEQTDPKRREKRNWRPVLRGVVCAACALALVLGTVHLRPVEESGGQPGGSPVMTLDYSFGLTAYAAETGETVTPNANGGLALTASKDTKPVYTVLDRETAEHGKFTNYRFQISGGDIRTVKLDIDRGGLYRCNGNGEMISLGSSVQEPYNPSVSYGLWVPPEAFQPGGEKVDFDGAELRVTAVFSDETERTERYLLTEEKLRTFQSEDGTATLVPGLAGDEQADIQGLYAARIDSRWLQWPVQDSRTVWLSNPYGGRQVSVEQPTPEDPAQTRTTFHSGIDIPADQGAVILAAADGTVTETGFDAAKGNYLVLDHGGGLTTMYAHCRNVDVKEGDTVCSGEMIASVGSTGMSTGPHLHFEVRQDGQAQNPVAYFDSTIRDTLKAE